MNRNALLHYGLLCISLCSCAAEPDVSFEREIAPIFSQRCVKCHSGPRPKGDLDLTRNDRLRAGGSSGAVVVSGKSAESVLFEYLRDKKMPPKQPLSAKEIEAVRRWIDAGADWRGPPLALATAAETRRAGDDWWSLRRLRRPTLPIPTNVAWVRTPIDAFIADRLDKQGLKPSPEVDRSNYVRRVTLDLTGLLPTPKEIAAFVNDSSADAYEKLVDRLLASPAYGERWARHWLDVVRFAESHGYEMNTLRPNAWPYRDYVIRAFNRDISYPQFVREQLAGDALEAREVLNQAATGFLVGGPHDMVGNATPEGRAQQRMDDLADMVSTTGATFLGLTIGCARCHDHKFDPIAQKDFYAMQAVFAGVEHNERSILVADDGTRSRERQTIRSALEDLNGKLDRLEPLATPRSTTASRAPVQPGRNVERFTPVAARFVRFTVKATIDGSEPCIDELELYGPDGDGNLASAARGARATASSVYPNNALHRIEHVNDGRLGNAHSWISREPGSGWVQIELPKSALVERIVWGRDREQRYRDRLPRDYRIEVSANGHVWNTVAGSWDRHPPGHASTETEAVARLVGERKRLEERLLELEKPLSLYAGVFRAPDPTHLLRRGDPMQKLESVQPSAPTGIGPRFNLKENATEAERRLALAEWIAHPDNPLPARVMVNRVWSGHFGQGLVRTPSDFGFNGDRPSHPELLDWLATEYQRNGWHLKPLHRLIVLSNTYRQASRLDATAMSDDADNRLLARYPRRRIEAEVIRDILLQVSGALDRRMEGPGYHLWDYSGYVIVFAPKARLGPDAFRRMIYQFKPRLQQDATFGVFDCPDATTTMPRRNRSTTALQALNLLNDPFVLDQSDRFAARLVREESGPDCGARIRRAFLLCFGRDPSPREADAARELVQKHGLAAFCRALYNTNELIFVD